MEATENYRETINRDGGEYYDEDEEMIKELDFLTNGEFEKNFISKLKTKNKQKRGRRKFTKKNRKFSDENKSLSLNQVKSMFKDWKNDNNVFRDSEGRIYVPMKSSSDQENLDLYTICLMEKTNDGIKDPQWRNNLGYGERLQFPEVEESINIYNAFLDKNTKRPIASIKIVKYIGKITLSRSTISALCETSWNRS